MNLIELERGEDIISKLPNHILSHILSRLETKDAFKTCLLSSRWKDLWTLIYNLHFKYPDNSKDGTLIYNLRSKYLDNSKDGGSSGFENFVDYVLSRCQSQEIQDFFIFFHFSDDTRILSRVAPWICFAIEHKVQNLEISAFYNTPDDERLPIRLPQSILICKTLVKLKLCSGYCDFVFDILDSVVCFPSLKILHFEAYRSNSNLMQKFFRSCPVLEELTIRVYIEHNENVLTFDITVPTLKTLEIYLESDWGGPQYSSIHKFVVRARNLERLYINDETLASFVMDETPYISDASLDGCFDMSTLYEPSIPSKDEASRAMVLLRAIKNTKFLSLSEVVMRVLSVAFDSNLPTFPNLIQLNAGIDAYFGWKLLPHFLNNSPNLEALSLTKEYSYYITFEGYTYFDLENVPSCLLLHVEKIEMINMMGDFDELEVMRYFLKNGKVLKSFLVCFCKSIDDKIMNQISTFPRGSDLCEVEFY